MSYLDEFDPTILFVRTGIEHMDEGKRANHAAQIKDAFENEGLQAEFVEFIKKLYVDLAMFEGDECTRKSKRATIELLQAFWTSLKSKALQSKPKPIQTVSDKLN